MEYHWFFFSHSIPQSRSPRSCLGVLMGAVTGAWEEVGRLEWEVGHSCGRSDRGPEALLPTHPLPLLSKQNSTLQTLTFSLSDFTNLPFSTLKLSHFNSLLFCCIQSLLGPSPALLRTWPGTKGLFSEQQGVLFLLCSLLSLPPILSHSSVNSKVFSLCSPSNPSLPPYLSPLCPLFTNIFTFS